MGKHKLHAFGVSGREGKAILGVMPTKGGKSTLLLEFLKDASYSLISDDTPVITRSGKILSFPLRIGLEGGTAWKEAYELKREYFGLKKLISLEDVSYSVAVEARKAVLFLGKRYPSKKCHVVKIGKIRMLFHLFIHMVVGWGLPIVFEYFWEHTLIDFFKKIKIFFSRLLSATLLTCRSKTYMVYLGSDFQVNKNTIEKLM